MKEFTRSGTTLPHDLRHFVVEQELGISDGIWGGIAAGMVYTSMEHVQGRRPPHSALRSAELMRAQQQRLMRAELLANLVEAIAKLDNPAADQIGRLARRALPGLARGLHTMPRPRNSSRHRARRPGFRSPTQSPR